MIKIIIDSVGCDIGHAFVYCDPRSPVKDPRIDGRFGRAQRGVCLETYSSAELSLEAESFVGVYLEAPTRRSAIEALLRTLGYPRGVDYDIRFERA